MISITGQNTGNERDPKPLENACHRRFSSHKKFFVVSRQINKHGNNARTTAASKWKVVKGGTLALQSFFGQSPCVQGIRGKCLSLRTIAQDLTSFSKQFDHSGHWWVTPMSLFQIPAGRYFHPLPPENGWDLRGTVFCRSKVLWNPPSTLNPELLQHWVLKIFRWWTWETTCQDHRYYVKNIDLKTWMTGSLQETSTDKYPQTEATKLHSACKKVASDKPQKN